MSKANIFWRPGPIFTKCLRITPRKHVGSELETKNTPSSELDIKVMQEANFYFQQRVTVLQHSKPKYNLSL